MFCGKLHLLKIALLLVGTAAPLFGGNFAPPAEGLAAFRRDRVPLDSDTMMDLSARLTTLADGLEGKDARERRCAAQMLAISLALDPVNSEARKLIKQFTKKNRQPNEDSVKLGEQRTRVWHFIGWLETPEAGADGQALATCLKDVLAISDPEDPRAEALLAQGELGAWTGWIPELSAYENAKAVVRTPDPEVPKETPKRGILLTEATVSVPVWKQVKNSDPARWFLAVSPLDMKARWSPEGESGEQPFSISIGDSDRRESFSPLAATLLKLLEKQHGNLPKGGRVRINSPAINVDLPPKMRHSISAAVAVLASAAITGREPAATIVGLVDESGAFTLPDDYWEQLRSIENGAAKRLILPASVAADLPSILALGYPEFFMDHEILLAKDFQHLLELSAREPDESLAKSLAQFQEIREKSASQPLGQYVANIYVRRRLEEVAQAAPFHFSARMLAMQGAGARPAFITGNVLNSELVRALQPLQWLINHDQGESLTQAEEKLVGTTYESCRSAVENLKRFTGTDGHQAIDKVSYLVNLIRALERTLRSRSDLDYSETYLGSYSAYNALLKSYRDVMAGLSPATDQ